MNCFKFVFLFQLFSLFKILYSLKQVNIAEGLTKYYIEAGKVETFKFTAINDGYYLFTFRTWAIVKEATGQIHQDVDLRKQRFYTMAYAQKFVKGNYVKFDYPDFERNYDDYFPIKIEKLDNNINLRLLTGDARYHHFETIFFDNCKNPIYLLLENTLSSNPVYFKAIIHSGVFTAKYKATDYTAQENEYINNNMENLNLNGISQLPKQFYRNIVELKCQIPGVITILQTITNNGYVSYQYNYGSIHNIFLKDYDISYTTASGYFYFQMINIHGCATIDMTEFNKKTYDCEDFSLKYYSYEQKYLRVHLKNVQSPYWLLGILHSPGEDNGKTLLIEKEEYSINSGERMVIPIEIGNKKKNIKIKSTLPKFYWSLEFTLENNVNYVPFPYSDKIKYENSDILYIRNPYSYENIKTDYYWFIVLYHYNEGSTPKFSYEYTDEGNYQEEDEEKEDEKKEDEKKEDEKREEERNQDNNNNNQPSSTNEEKSQSLAENPFFWFSLILVVGIIGFLIYFKFFRKKENSIENLVKEGELNKLNSE